MLQHIAKFGTQAKKSPVIWVFRHGDKHHTGVKMTLKAYKTMDQVSVLKCPS